MMIMMEVAARAAAFRDFQAACGFHLPANHEYVVVIMMIIIIVIIMIMIIVIIIIIIIIIIMIRDFKQHAVFTFLHTTNM